MFQMFSEKFFLKFFDNVKKNVNVQIRKVEKIFVNFNPIIGKTLLSTIEQLKEFNLNKLNDGNHKFCYFIPNTRGIAQQHRFPINSNWVQCPSLIGNLIIVDHLIDEQIISELM